MSARKPRTFGAAAIRPTSWLSVGLVGRVGKGLLDQHAGELVAGRLHLSGPGDVDGTVAGEFGVERAIGRQAGRHPGQRGDLARVGVGDAPDALAGHQAVEGRAEGLVGEARAGGGDAQHLHKLAGPRDNPGAGVARPHGGTPRSHAGRIDRAWLQRGRGRGVAADDGELDRRQLRRAPAPVVGGGLHHDARADRPLLQPEGAGAGRLGLDRGDPAATIGIEICSRSRICRTRTAVPTVMVMLCAPFTVPPSTIAIEGRTFLPRFGSTALALGTATSSAAKGASPSNVTPSCSVRHPSGCLRRSPGRWRGRRWPRPARCPRSGCPGGS